MSDYSENYSCSRCGEPRVSMDSSWGVPGMEYEEVIYHDYYCNNCEAETSVRGRDDTYEPGDTIEMD